MNWLKSFFLGKQKEKKVAPATREKPKAVIEIWNNYGIYDSSPLLVEESPDIEKIFNDPDPPVIQRLSDANREYWSTASAEDRRITALIGYLQHPDPEVRRAVMKFIPQNQSSMAVMNLWQTLFDRLGGDSDSSVRIAAAKTIWECERSVNCQFAVEKLKDEIEYGKEQSMVGPTRARKAFQLLIEYAPDQKARDALQELFSQ